MGLCSCTGEYFLDLRDADGANYHLSFQNGAEISEMTTEVAFQMSPRKLIIVQ